MDRRRFALLEALKLAAAERGEMRLYRRGKLPGLLAQRTRANAEIAQKAVADGLLEVARVETVGKATIEWVRVTQKGIDFLLESESPVHALQELSALLAANQDGLPHWAARMQARIDAATQAMHAEVEVMRQQLELVSRRVAEAIERLESRRVPTPVPWMDETVDYLKRRQQVGLGPRCPLADLYATLKAKHVDLTIRDFHAGLRKLHEAETITLLPSAGSGDAPGPEYAMLDGPAVYYYVARKTAA
jgi:hypothetical protein